MKLNYSRLLLAYLSILVPSDLYGAVDDFALVSPTDGDTRIVFTIDYSLGTHEGRILDAQGKVSYNFENQKLTQASFKVPISEIRTGDEERDCHMVEALGLDYSASEFPEEHVCSDKNTLPKEGGNSVRYPNIEFEVEKVEIKTEPFKKEKDGVLVVTGIWKIHGQDHKDTIQMTYTPTEDGFQLSGKTQLDTDDFGITVKSAKILFVTISTDDKVNIDLNLHFKKQ